PGRQAGDWVRQPRERDDPLGGSILDRMRDPHLCPTCLPILSSGRDWVTAGTIYTGVGVGAVVAAPAAAAASSAIGTAATNAYVQATTALSAAGTTIANALGPNGPIFGTRFGGNDPLLNSGDKLRIGWSYIRSTGEYVFR